MNCLDCRHFQRKYFGKWVVCDKCFEFSEFSEPEPRRKAVDFDTIERINELKGGDIEW